MSVLTYEAPYPVYALDWCKTTGAGGASHLPRSSYRLALGAFQEDYRNRISIIGLPDERPLDDIQNQTYPSLDESGTAYQESFVPLADAVHGYPVTKIGWEPTRIYRESWKDMSTELLTTTGDALRIWEFSDEYVGPGSYVGRQSAGPPGKLTQKIALQSVRLVPLFSFFGISSLVCSPVPSPAHLFNSYTSLRSFPPPDPAQQTKNPNPITAPLTSFSWNTMSPNLIVTSSIDTTCTVWDISTSSAITQLIAHDREVYDVAWVPGSVDAFVSVGADGSLRAFDLRSLEHSTILYETPSVSAGKKPAATPSMGNPLPPTPTSGPSTPAPLLRLSFNPYDANYLSTFHTDSSSIQILDMRSPGKPVVELRAHSGPVSAVGWSRQDSGVLASCADDCQVLVWDLGSQGLYDSKVSSSRSPRPDASSSTNASGSGGNTGTGSGTNSGAGGSGPRISSEPILSYTAPSEINNLAWSPNLVGGAYTREDGRGAMAPTGEWVAIAAGRSIRALKV